VLKNFLYFKDKYMTIVDDMSSSVAETKSGQWIADNLLASKEERQERKGYKERFYTTLGLLSDDQKKLALEMLSYKDDDYRWDDFNYDSSRTDDSKEKERMGLIAD